MVFVTGDTHRFIDFQKLVLFARNHPELTKDDYMIIAGDFGFGLHSGSALDDLIPYSELPFTILFVDGNHENYDLLDEYPVENWHGGKVQFLKKDIIHLMRGQVFEIDGKKIFTFGGATSIDKEIRLAFNLGWWERETPTYEEFIEAMENLKKHDNKVDYIITHNCPEKDLYYSDIRLFSHHANLCAENRFLTSIDSVTEYKHWYFGHHHIDAKLSDKHTVLYQQIKELI